MSARDVAAQVLLRVDRDKAFASAALDVELKRNQLDVRDAALATEIVYGVTRNIHQIDKIINQYLAKKAKVDPWIQAILRSAVYQMQFLERVPGYAIVNDSVFLVRKKRGPRVAGFVNAILRSITKNSIHEPSHRLPVWLSEMFEHDLGKERAQKLIEREKNPSLDLRVVLTQDIDAVLREIRKACPQAIIERGNIAPRALKIYKAGDARRLPGFSDGHFVVQEEGAQIIAALVNAQPGESIADVCAGRGIKTAALSEVIGEKGKIVAFDIHENRLNQIQLTFNRLQIQCNLQTEAIDISVGTGGYQDEFDRVLVDAPCTGLGTWWRRPEIINRIQEQDPERLGQLQRKILEGSAKLVRKGGTLIYAVCSPLHAEGINIIKSLSGFSMIPFQKDELLGLESDDDGVLRLGPWVDTDAYQIVRWIRD